MPGPDEKNEDNDALQDREYQKKSKTRPLREAVRKWRNSANTIEKLLADEESSLELLRSERDKLYSCLSDVDRCREEAEPFYEYEEDLPCDVDDIEADHRELAKQLGQHIREQAEERRSRDNTREQDGERKIREPERYRNQSGSNKDAINRGFKSRDSIYPRFADKEDPDDERREAPKYLHPDFMSQATDVPRSHTQFSKRGCDTTSMSDIAKLLKKPQFEVTKFSGDPTKYSRFIRQFKFHIAKLCDEPEELMNYLECYTEGEAHRIVIGFSHLPAEAGFEAAIEELQKRYGNCQVIANSYIEKIMRWPNIAYSDSKGLDDFSILLTECLHAIGEVKGLGVLEYSANMREIVRKLPESLHDKWRGVVHRLSEEEKSLNFKHLVDFVGAEARKANDCVFGKDLFRSTDTSQGKVRESKAMFATVPVADDKYSAFTSQSSYRPDCSFCNEKHYLSQCQQFVSINMDAKVKHIRDKALCFGCLKPNHIRLDCRGRLSCDVCKGRHPTPLHRNLADDGHATVSERMTNQLSAHTSYMGAGNCTLAIIPVKVKLEGELKVIQTYAFLDPGSSACFCTEDILSQLGGSGRKMSMSIETMGGPFTLDTQAVEGLQISGLKEDVFVPLPEVFSKTSMPVNRDHIPNNADIRQWPHLRDVDLPVIQSEVGLLIGNNVPAVYSPLETKTGNVGTPHASRSIVGWIPWNVIRQRCDKFVPPTIDRIETIALEHNQELQHPDQMVGDSKNRGYPEKLINDKKELFSLKDKTFITEVKNTIHGNDGHCHINLPFSEENVQVTDESLTSLCKRRDFNLTEWVNKMICDDKPNSTIPHVCRTPSFSDSGGVLLSSVAAEPLSCRRVLAEMGVGMHVIAARKTNVVFPSAKCVYRRCCANCGQYNTPRNTWALGRIVDVYPDRYGLVRVFKVKTKAGFLAMEAE